MKIAITAGILTALLSARSGVVSAFSVATPPPVTGFKGKAAASKEEDLMLTMQIILDHESRSATVSKEQYVQQMEAAAPAAAAAEPEAPAKAAEPVDLSIPYDAAAKLAYEASDKSMKYEAFKTKYEEDSVAYVKSKQPVDISIPYDAAAKLAYEASDKSMSFADFKPKYEADVVAKVAAKFKASQPEKKAAPAPKAKKAAAPAPPAASSTADISIPYDAAAKLAYEASDKSSSYEDFKAKYEAEAVAMVTRKKLERGG